MTPEPPTPLHLYEAIRWGNDSDDVDTGGPNGGDTCFLVRAASVEQAAALADAQLARMPHERVTPWCHAIYLLGTDGGTGTDSRILRGPYVQHAYPHGWRQWLRNGKDDAWAEPPPDGQPAAPVYPVREISASDAALIASLPPIPVRVKFFMGSCQLQVPRQEPPVTFRWLGRDVVTERGVLAWPSESKHASVLRRRAWHPHTIVVIEDGEEGGAHPIQAEE